MPLLKKKIIKKKETKKSPVKAQATKHEDEELAAVIAAAIYLNSVYVTPQENYKMTIKMIDKPYSPWSSKNHMMRKWPRKK